MSETPAPVWRTASRCSGGNCVQMAWVRSALCTGGQCVEVAHQPDEVWVRDSKLGDDSPVLRFTVEEFAAFADGVRGGEFDLAGECSTPVPVQAAPSATESAPHPPPGVRGSLNAPERISALRERYAEAIALWALMYPISAWALAEGDGAERLAGNWGRVAAKFVEDVRDSEMETLRAQIARVRAEHAAIHAEMDDYAKRHNRACECEVIPTTRETADRMLSAPSVPAPPKETPA